MAMGTDGEETASRGNIEDPEENVHTPPSVEDVLFARPLSS
jgi:hypothetical protein